MKQWTWVLRIENVTIIAYSERLLSNIPPLQTSDYADRELNYIL